MVRRYQPYDRNKQERRAVKRFGGNPNIRMGADGSRRGRPLEVKSARKDDRYRINKLPHKKMIRNKGTYIFLDKRGHSTLLPAKVVSKLIGGKAWLKDRSYPHKFIDISKV